MFNIAICDETIEEIQKIEIIVAEFMKEHLILHCITLFTSGEELLASKEQFDVAILGITMGNMSGIETGKKLYRKNLKIRIVYITDFHGYCSDAINYVHAFAYLSKPIEKEKLLEQIRELVKVIGMEKGNQIEIELSNIVEVNGEKEQEMEHLAVRISVADIIYYEYVKSTRFIRVKLKKKTYEYIGTLTDAEQKMAIYGFTMCHRGILVNFEYVMKAKGNTVYLKTGEKLPLSQKRAVKFKEQLSEYVHSNIS